MVQGQEGERTIEPPDAKPFRLEFSNRVIEHLGIKLYQNKPTNVVAEFLSNSWDADATRVNIKLFTDKVTTRPTIVITDNGRGMTRDELTDEFLVIGRNRRTSPDQVSAKNRTLMGRKGIGKLAGFGIAGTVDVISSPNLKLRESDVAERRFYWLRFTLRDLVAVADSAKATCYEPEVIADGIDKTAFQSLVSKRDCADVLTPFLSNVDQGEGGVCVLLQDTTLKRAMNEQTLLQSMGRRFTVSMLHQDFDVTINGKAITPDKALPPLHDFGFGDWNNPITETFKIKNTPRTVKYWAKFVNIESSDWSIEQAGVGIYAHGKIAQDRPFFFDVKGKEILSRYIYGVIEADWLDELPSDVVSTDRRSIDWDTDETIEFHNWGAAKISHWLEEFRKWRGQQPKREIVERIRKVSPKSSLTGQEEDALAELLNDVLPGLANDEDAKDRATKSFTEAWTHGPTRQLTQSLWERVFKSLNVEATMFADLVESLRKSMVPEAMGLAVTMAQRIAAITAMRKMIESSKTETHLQRLIETFPWLLGPKWERLTANQPIRTLVKENHRPNTAAGQWSLDEKGLGLKPDFVFLADPGGQEEFVVFELKGPEAGKTLQPAEYDQLNEYLRIIRNAYPDPRIEIKGILVGHDKGGFEEFDNRIVVKRWSEVLLEARNLHVEYLRALLRASDPTVTDARLQQIADFGGAETLELLSRLAPVGEYPDVITEMLRMAKLPDPREGQVPGDGTG